MRKSYKICSSLSFSVKVELSCSAIWIDLDATFLFCLKSVRKEFHVGLGKCQLSKSQNMESMLMQLNIHSHCH